MIIESQTKDNANLGLKTSIDFNRKFSANSIEDIKSERNSSPTSYTNITFKNINEEYAEQNEIENYNIDILKEEFFVKLLPMFIRFKNENKEFKISINKKLWLNKKNLDKSFNKHKFEKKSFNIKIDLAKFDKKNNDIPNEKTYTFNLDYRIIKAKTKDTISQFYGASDRYVKDFPKQTKIENLQEGYSGIFCLTSNYFEENRVKDSRTDFVIPPNQSNPTKENPITFPEINKELEKLLNEILKEKFPEIENELKEKNRMLLIVFRILEDM
ncbi:MAG: hypothetical protein ACK5LP_03755 [Campylobacteraceae bacterium]